MLGFLLIQKDTRFRKVYIKTQDSLYMTSSGLGFLEERKGSSEDADHAEVDGDETTTPVGKGSDGGTSSWRRREGGVRQF